MKLTCDCGNEMTFVPDEELVDDDKGTYVKKDFSKFDFWAEHDEAGMVCKKCGKTIWYFA